MWLVTGATGHIGNVLVRKLLERGEKVRALILPKESRESLKDLDVEIVEGDVLDLDSLFEPMRGIRGIFHLAGVISIMPGPDPVVRKVNVEGTKNVFQAAKKSGVKRMLYTSSIHAIRRVEEGIIDESIPYDMDNPYGAYDRSKAEATLEVLNSARDGLDAVVVCPTGVIGPHDYRGSMMGTVIHDAAVAKPTLYVDGAYDFVDVRDVADGMIAALKRGNAARVTSSRAARSPCGTCWRPCARSPDGISSRSKCHSTWQNSRHYSRPCITAWHMRHRALRPIPWRC